MMIFWRTFWVVGVVAWVFTTVEIARVVGQTLWVSDPLIVIVCVLGAISMVLTLAHNALKPGRFFD